MSGAIYWNAIGDRNANSIGPQSSSNWSWAIGYTHPFELFETRFGLGFALSGPFSKLRQFFAPAPQDVFALRYGTSDNQFKATPSLGVELIENHLYFGAGLSFFITTSGSTEVTLVADDPSSRLIMDVGLNSAVVTGLYAKADQHQVGFVFRQAIQPNFQQHFVGQVQVGDSNVLQQPMQVSANLYDEPQSLELDYQWNTAVQVSAGIRYQFWEGYQSAILAVATANADGNTVKTQIPQWKMRNTFSPRLSMTIPAWSNHLSLGYQYRPTPVTDSAGHLLDSDTHVVGVSLQREFTIDAYEFELSLSGQYHWLADRTIANVLYTGEAYGYGLHLRALL